MAAPIANRLTEIVRLGAGKTTVYANPASMKTYIRSIHLHNTDVADKYIEIWNVPDNAAAVGTADDTNKWIQVTVPTDESVFLEFGAPGIILVDENDSIQAEPEAADKITFQMYGFTEVV